MRLHGVEPKTLPAERYSAQWLQPFVEHTANDAGATRWSVLDEKRIASNDPWSPFGRATTLRFAAAAAYRSLKSAHDLLKRTYRSSVDKPFSDSMVVAVGTGYEKETLLLWK